MLKKDLKIISLLNEHYNLELMAANTYLNYSTIANKLGYVNVGKFMKKLSDDKIEAHLSRMYNFFIKISHEIFINETALPKKIKASTSIEELLKSMLNNELDLRKNITDIADVFLNSKDFESFEFIQWFVKDSIKDINDVSDVLTYVQSGNSNLLNIEAAVRHKLNEDDEDDEDDEE